MDTGSYEQFAEGYYLTAKAMAWFWDAYAPDLEQRGEPYASPLRASDEQLADLPPAFVIVDEADVLRDEGEAYAARLRAAGVAVTTVRYDGTTHDFMMLNPLSGSRATRAAVAQSIAVLREAFALDVTEDGLVREHASKLLARADVELAEHLVQVVLDRPRADEQPRADLGVGVPVAGQPCDLRLLRGEGVAGLDREPARGLAGGEQLAARALGERLGTEAAEALVGGAQELAGLGAPVLAPEPFPVT